MKKVKKGLEAIYKEIKATADRVEKLVATLATMDEAKPAAPKAKAPKKGRAKKPAAAKKEKTTAFDTVVGIIMRSKKGISAAQLKDKTGFDDKKIANIIYKAKKNGLIKSVTKGVYVKS
jgi:hypothetical protein